jgi:hypothetical protein
VYSSIGNKVGQWWFHFLQQTGKRYLAIIRTFSATEFFQ